MALLPGGHVMEEECFTNGNNGSFADNAGIVAIRIVHEGQSSHATVRTATPGKAILPGPARQIPAHQPAR